MTTDEQARLQLAEPLVRATAAVKRFGNDRRSPKREQWRQREVSEAGKDLAEALALLLEGKHVPAADG